ncbi:hypothetical protein [Scytonema sp. PRP1]|uniref:hypothetical protein n=1 Tax=Scytonema sp. PRP1 TaxID=3120513 RepID=UPI002FD40A2A
MVREPQNYVRGNIDRSQVGSISTLEPVPSTQGEEHAFLPHQRVRMVRDSEARPVESRTLPNSWVIQPNDLILLYN